MRVGIEMHKEVMTSGAYFALRPGGNGDTKAEKESETEYSQLGNSCYLGCT